MDQIFRGRVISFIFEGMSIGLLRPSKNLDNLLWLALRVSNGLFTVLIGDNHFCILIFEGSIFGLIDGFVLSHCLCIGLILFERPFSWLFYLLPYPLEVGHIFLVVEILFLFSNHNEL